MKYVKQNHIQSALSQIYRAAAAPIGHKFAESKWLIHDTKRHNNNQPHGPIHPCTSCKRMSDAVF